MIYVVENDLSVHDEQNMNDHDKQQMQENLDQQLYRLEQEELNDEP